MYLKSLTIKGFKSFAQATTFQFEPGVTAIVGPNGSGKSNIVDALSWVMGEQGVKTLRGGKMDDVIFAGTSSRGPLGRAEVTLTIDNADGALPIEYSEVTIRRTLFRQGASEYAINGETCRLRDVQDLLSDSGLGREMHVIVGQGQLDAVLRATPEDRRGFIEEAAGILKHRRRKERTARKLDAMESNLSRLNDLAGELRRQLTPLGRQAEVARVAQHIAAVVRDAKARLAADDIVTLRTQMAQLTQDETALVSMRTGAQERLSDTLAAISKLEAAQQRDERDAARRVVLDLEAAHTKLSAVAHQAQQRVQFFTRQREDLSPVPGVTTQDIIAADAVFEGFKALLPETIAASEHATAAARAAQHDLDACDAARSDVMAQRAQLNLTLQRLLGDRDAAERTLHLRREEYQHRSDAAAAIRDRQAALQRELAVFVRPEESDHSPYAPTDEDYQRAVKHQADAEAAVSAAQQRVHELQQAHAAFEARISALQLSLAQRDGSAGVLESEDSDFVGRVSDHLRVRTGYELAVAAALGSYADAILVTDPNAAVRAVETAVTADLGQLAVVWEQPVSEQAEPTRAEFVAALRGIPGALPVHEVVEMAPNLHDLLAYSCVVSDLVAAVNAAAWLREHQSAVPWTVVTQTGATLTARTLSGGSVRAPSRIELHAEIERAQQGAAEVAAQLGQELTMCEALRVTARETAEETQTVFARVRAVDAERAERARVEQGLLARIEAVQSEAERAEVALSAATAAVGAAEAGAVASATVLAAAELAAETNSLELPDDTIRSGLVRASEAARAAELEQRVALETLREREAAARARAEVLRTRYADDQAALARAAERARVRAAQCACAVRVREAVSPVQDACQRSLDEARAVLQECEIASQSAQHELVALRARAEGERERVVQLTEQLHSLQLRSHDAAVQCDAVRDRALSELGLTEEVLCVEYGPQVRVPCDEEPARVAADASVPRTEMPRVDSLEADLARAFGFPATADANDSVGAAADQAESPASVPYVRAEQLARLKRAQRRLGGLGRFNPLALEEFAALEQRHNYLTDQLDDLKRTREDLLRIMRDLDDKMEQIFSAAFADTQAAFAQVFPVLFPGGSGEISLTDPSDIGATGIEMTVRPAGKNVARLSLLSGGERSLAAIAWLLAIFHARPSPFYIMDEVEAALDDANLGRLLQTFAGLRESSQLIVITHQKRTMEIADALYGVSMRHDGVSAVVGQRLTPAE